MKAQWKGITLADSEKTIVIENNHYFPASSVNMDYLVASQTTTHCPWKGEASYYSIVVDGQQNQDAAWCYQSPKPAAEEIAGYIAFWRGVEVSP